MSGDGTTQFSAMMVRDLKTSTSFKSQDAKVTRLPQKLMVPLQLFPSMLLVSISQAFRDSGTTTITVLGSPEWDLQVLALREKYIFTRSSLKDNSQSDPYAKCFLSLAFYIYQNTEFQTLTQLYSILQIIC
jgi:hypothetical protein